MDKLSEKDKPQSSGHSSGTRQRSDGPKGKFSTKRDAKDNSHAKRSEPDNSSGGRGNNRIKDKQQRQEVISPSDQKEKGPSDEHFDLPIDKFIAQQVKVLLPVNTKASGDADNVSESEDSDSSDASSDSSSSDSSGSSEISRESNGPSVNEKVNIWIIFQ